MLEPELCRPPSQPELMCVASLPGSESWSGEPPWVITLWLSIAFKTDEKKRQVVLDSLLMNDNDIMRGGADQFMSSESSAAAVQ